MIGLEQEKKMLKNAVKGSHNVLLIGETGVGKTALVYDIAKESKATTKRVNLNGEIGLNELLGKWLVKEGSTFWRDGIVTECMRKGWWIILDEINAALPEVLFCLNALMDDGRCILLAEKDNEEVRPHKDFRIFATMNPCEGYTGTKEMNAALLSRFHLVVKMHGYGPTMEKDILKSHVKIKDSYCDILVDMAHYMRGLRDEEQLSYYFSTRDLINMAKVWEIDYEETLSNVFNYTIFGRIADDEKKFVAENIGMRYKKKLNIDLNVKIEALPLDSMQEDIVKLNQEIKDLLSKKNSIKDQVEKLKNGVIEDVVSKAVSQVTEAMSV